MSTKFDRLDPKGNEVLDDTPVSIPIKFMRAPTDLQTFRQMLSLASREAAQQGMETFAESEDFDVGDDFDPSSQWELEFDQITGREMTKEEALFVRESRAHFDKQFQTGKKGWKDYARRIFKNSKSSADPKESASTPPVGKED